MCRRYRLPHSALFADGDGTWSDADTALAVAYERWLAADSAETCPSCGTRHDDWIDPETLRLLDEPAWAVQTVTCYGCKEISEARDTLTRNGEATGVSVILTRPASDDDDPE